MGAAAVPLPGQRRPVCLSGWWGRGYAAGFTVLSSRLKPGVPMVCWPMLWRKLVVFENWSGVELEGLTPSELSGWQRDYLLKRLDRCLPIGHGGGWTGIFNTKVVLVTL